MINNPVGISVDRVSTKDNDVEDIASEMITLCQEFPQLRSCQRFLPSAELTSLILETLSTKQYVDPLLASRRVLASPGRIIT